MDSYHLYHATRADLLRRLGRNDEAAARTIGPLIVGGLGFDSPCADSTA